MEDIINPKRYTENSIECWDFWLRYGLNPLIASAVKYIWRYKNKNGVHDLEKALVFLDKARREALEVEFSDKNPLVLPKSSFGGFSELQYIAVINSTLTTKKATYHLGIDNMVHFVNILIKEEYKNNETNSREE